MTGTAAPLLSHVSPDLACCNIVFPRTIPSHPPVSYLYGRPVIHPICRESREKTSAAHAEAPKSSPADSEKPLWDAARSWLNHGYWQEMIGVWAWWVDTPRWLDYVQAREGTELLCYVRKSFEVIRTPWNKYVPGVWLHCSMDIYLWILQDEVIIRHWRGTIRKLQGEKLTFI